MGELPSAASARITLTTTTHEAAIYAVRGEAHSSDPERHDGGESPTLAATQCRCRSSPRGPTCATALS